MTNLTAAEREHHARKFMPLARALAYRNSQAHDRDDVLSDAMLGLAKAIDSFQEDRGASFNSWAHLKVMGAIRDGKRAGDPLSRSRRREMIAAGESDPSTMAPLSLHTPVDTAEGVELGDTLPDRQADHDLRVDIRQAIAKLPARRRLVVAAAAHGYTLREIGDLLGITEARVCQIRTRALADMRDRLAA